MPTTSQPAFALPPHLGVEQAESLVMAMMALPLESGETVMLNAAATESITAAGAQILVAFEKSAKASQAKIELTDVNFSFSQAMREMGLGFLVTTLP